MLNSLPIQRRRGVSTDRSKVKSVKWIILINSINALTLWLLLTDSLIHLLNGCFARIGRTATAVRGPHFVVRERIGRDPLTAVAASRFRLHRRASLGWFALQARR